eukprot:1140171-Rhodomonas_salina.1
MLLRNSPRRGWYQEWQWEMLQYNPKLKARYPPTVPAYEPARVRAQLLERIQSEGALTTGQMSWGSQEEATLGPGAVPATVSSYAFATACPVPVMLCMSPVLLSYGDAAVVCYDGATACPVLAAVPCYAFATACPGLRRGMRIPEREVNVTLSNGTVAKEQAVLDQVLKELGLFPYTPKSNTRNRNFSTTRTRNAVSWLRLPIQPVRAVRSAPLPPYAPPLPPYAPPAIPLRAPATRLRAPRYRPRCLLCVGQCRAYAYAQYWCYAHAQYRAHSTIHGVPVCAVLIYGEALSVAKEGGWKLAPTSGTEKGPGTPKSSPRKPTRTGVPAYELSYPLSRGSLVLMWRMLLRITPTDIAYDPTTTRY